MTIATNSIIRHIEPNVIANEARMMRIPAEKRTGKKLAIIIVEGNADQLFCTTVFDISKCLVITAHGKDNVIQTVQILITTDTPGVLGIVDDDFDTLEGRNRRNAHLAVTDTHDIETLLFISSSLDKLLNTLLLPEKRIFLVDFSEEVRTKLIELASPIGFVRWFFQRENLCLDFRNVSLRAYIDKRKLTFDLDAYVEGILSRNADCLLTKSDIQNRIIGLMKENPNPWLLCRGHDLILIFILILPRLLSPYAPLSKPESDCYFSQIQQKIPNENRFIEQLIMCYEQEEFRKTNIYKYVTAWEIRNPSYQILRK